MLIYDWNLLVALVFGARVTSVPDSHVLYAIFIHCLQWPWVIRLRVLMDENGCVALRLWFETWKFTVLPQVKVWLQNEIAANLCSLFLNQNEIAANLRLGNCASVNYCNPVYTLPISCTRQVTAFKLFCCLKLMYPCQNTGAPRDFDSSLDFANC